MPEREVVIKMTDEEKAAMDELAEVTEALKSQSARRDELIRKLIEMDFTTREVGDVAEMNASTISRIARGITQSS